MLLVLELTDFFREKGSYGSGDLKEFRVLLYSCLIIFRKGSEHGDAVGDETDEAGEWCSVKEQGKNEGDDGTENNEKHIECIVTAVASVHELS